MKQISVALVDLGEQLSDFLERLVKRLNSIQDTYCFTVETAIPALGDPDVSYQWYYAEHLLDKIRNHHHAAEYDYMIGLTHVRITLETPDPDDVERDYFSCGDYIKHAIISMDTNLLGYLSSATKKIQYAAFLVAGELLCARAKTDLCHTVINRCLFDDCSDRKNISHNILAGSICGDCRSALKKASIGNVEIASVEKILKWAKRRTGRGSIWARVAQNSLTSLAVGTIIGWVSSVYITAQNCVPAIIMTLLVPCIVAAFYAIKDRQANPLSET